MAGSEVVQLSRAERPWKPRRHRKREEEEEGMDPEERQTQEILRHVRSVLNKLTPQMFQCLMRKMSNIPICSERRLRAVIEIVFEKAISEPQFSEAYANMCRCLMGLKVPMEHQPDVTVNFRKLLLNHCQKEMERTWHVDVLEENGEQQQHSKEDKEEMEKELRQRSVGTVRFIGELFKLKMLTEPIMHDCIVSLLKTASEECLECVSVLLSTVGKDLDFEKAKPRMDQYFNQMEKIINEWKISNKIRFMLQDVIDLRQANWIRRHGDLGPQTIDKIREESMEEVENFTQFKKSFPAFSHSSKSGDMELFWCVHCMVNKLTPQTFQPLMKQLSEMPINSEIRLKGVIDLVFERALLVPRLSATYANVCRCLAKMKVPAEHNWRKTLNFRELLLNCCQKEFECDRSKEDEEQTESGAQCEEDEQEEARAKGLRRSLGNIKFISELFKLKMLTEALIHDCIVKLIKSSQQECLCLLLLTVGKDLDFEKAKPRMDQYFNKIKEMIEEENVSPTIQCLLQDVVDLRERHWVPKHTDPSLDNIIDQICQDSAQRKDAPQSFPAFCHSSKSGDMELFWCVHCMVNKLTPQTFQPFMKQLSKMPINSEIRLKGVIDLVFERALLVPRLSATYANVCRCLAKLKVPAEHNRRETLNFRKLLLNRCQKEFECDRSKEEQTESGAQCEEDEQEEARAKALRRSLGNIKFISELFKLKMLTEGLIHDCIVKLIKSSQEECLCLLLLTVGKDLDLEKAKPRMDQYFNKIKKIIEKKNVSPTIQCLLQDVVDLRERHWVPKHTKPSLDNIIDQICQDSAQRKVKIASNSPQVMPDAKPPNNTETSTEELPKNTETRAEEPPNNTETSTEELPKNTETRTEEPPNNTETSTEKLPKNTETNTEELLKNTETNTEELPKNTETRTEEPPNNTETSTEELPKNTETRTEEPPNNTETSTEKLPKNTETNTEELLKNTETNTEELPKNTETRTEEPPNNTETSTEELPKNTETNSEELLKNAETDTEELHNNTKISTEEQHKNTDTDTGPTQEHMDQHGGTTQEYID